MKQWPMNVEYIELSPEECEELKALVQKDKLWEEMPWGKRDWAEGTAKGEPEPQRLVDLETSHLENILLTQVQLTPFHRATILALLKQRWATMN